MRVKTLQKNATENATENLDNIQANGRRGEYITKPVTKCDQLDAPRYMDEWKCGNVKVTYYTF